MINTDLGPIPFTPLGNSYYHDDTTGRIWYNQLDDGRPFSFSSLVAVDPVTGYDPNNENQERFNLNSSTNLAAYGPQFNANLQAANQQMQAAWPDRERSFGGGGFFNNLINGDSDTWGPIMMAAGTAYLGGQVAGGMGGSGGMAGDWGQYPMADPSGYYAGGGMAGDFGQYPMGTEGGWGNGATAPTDLGAPNYGGGDYLGGAPTPSGMQVPQGITMPNGDTVFATPAQLLAAGSAGQLAQYGITSAAALRTLLSSQGINLSGMGGGNGLNPNGGGGGGGGGSLLNTGLALAPVLAAINYARNQTPFDTSRLTASLGDIPTSYNTDTSQLRSIFDRLDPEAAAGAYDLQTGEGRTALAADQARRMIGGSSFATQDFTNFDTTRDIGRRTLINNALTAQAPIANNISTFQANDFGRGLTAQTLRNNINTQILNADISGQKQKNDLYGQSLLALGNIFRTGGGGTGGGSTGLPTVGGLTSGLGDLGNLGSQVWNGISGLGSTLAGYGSNFSNWLNGLGSNA